MLENKARVSHALMWDILRLPCWRIRVDLFLEDEYKRIWKIKVLDIFADLLVPLGCLTWEHLGLSLAWLWYLNLGFKLVWCCDHLLDIHLDIHLAWCLAWHLKNPLSHGKDLWFDFHSTHCLDWWLALENNIWLAYHSDFHLHPYLNIQVLEMS